jgi:hypothetical protein
MDVFGTVMIVDFTAIQNPIRIFGVTRYNEIGKMIIRSYSLYRKRVGAFLSFGNVLFAFVNIAFLRWLKLLLFGLTAINISEK